MKSAPTAILVTVDGQRVDKPKRGGRPKNEALRVREYLTPDEVETLAQAAKRRGRYGSRDALMIRFTARHGLRASELCGLVWDQIKFDTGQFHVRRLKNGLASIHILDGDEIRALRAWKRESESAADYVFVNERKAPFVRAGFQRIVERAGVAAGFNFPVHPHMLRHATGYRQINERRPVREIQQFLGHKNIQHTVGYTELDANRFKGW
jgi:integrase